MGEVVHDTSSITDGLTNFGLPVRQGLDKLIAEINGRLDAFNLAPNAVVTSRIADNAVTTPKIPDNAITTPKILDAAVTRAKLNVTGFFFRERLIYTASGSFIRGNFPWLRAVEVHVLGGGGGGSGAVPTTSTQYSVGASAGAGAYAYRFVEDPTLFPATAAVTVGAGGAGGSGAAGGSGGTSSIQFSGSTISASGGFSGGTPVAVAPPFLISGGAGGTVTENAVVSGGGGHGFTGMGLSGVAPVTGAGGASGGPFGWPGGNGIVVFGQANGVAGLGYGSGGSGGGNDISQGSPRFGGNGAPGLVVLDLYG